MFCKNCGKDIDDNAVVCPHCGVATKSTEVQPQASGSNGLAIAGFVLSLLGFNLIALILSIVGLNKAKKLGGTGKGFAIAGIIISAVSMVIFIIVFAAECSAIMAIISSGG